MNIRGDMTQFSSLQQKHNTVKKIIFLCMTDINTVYKKQYINLCNTKMSRKLGKNWCL